jgi:hypothetical protein
MSNYPDEYPKPPRRLVSDTAVGEEFYLLADLQVGTRDGCLMVQAKAELLEPTDYPGNHCVLKFRRDKDGLVLVLRPVNMGAIKGMPMTGLVYVEPICRVEIEDRKAKAKSS